MLITILHSWLLICSSKALNLAISCLQCSSSARGPVSSASFRIWSLSANIYILFMNIIMKTLKQCTHDYTSVRNTHIYSLRREIKYSGFSLQWILVITFTLNYVISVITLETQNTKLFLTWTFIKCSRYYVVPKCRSLVLRCKILVPHKKVGA